MRTASVILWLALVPMAAGCGAGLTADLLTYDNIDAAVVEAKKGVNALDIAVRSSDQKRQASMWADLEASVIQAGGDPKLAADTIVAMKTHWANYQENDHRRQAIVGATLDNLDYISELCEKGKAFSLYRADVSVQWTQYLETVGKNRLRTVPAAPTILAAPITQEKADVPTPD